MKKDDKVRSRLGSVGRRDLLKVSAGVALGQMLPIPKASAETPAAARPAGVIAETGTGWKNDANRSSGNGPMDNTTRQIVQYVSSFSESNLSEAAVETMGYIMMDSIASLMAGFESEPARICARLARTTQSDLKSTVLGYGVTTSPELAAFANGCMLRHTDFNDYGPGGHPSDIISGILAVAEALHSTGMQTLGAVAMGYEIIGALALASPGDGVGDGGWDGPYEGLATALAVGKLMGLNEDQLANALSLALVPHMPMIVSHIGALSHWKGCHSSESIRCAIFAALMAKEGMTGPSEPFEARHGLFDHMGRFKELHLPAGGPDGRMIVQRISYKRYPAEASTQSVIEMVPQIKAWTKVEDIQSIVAELPFDGWQEIADPPKWDPRNRETADHSFPYVLSRALLDGDIYLDSYTPEKFMDPVARRLMDKITVRANMDYTYLGQARLTVRTKTDVLVKETAVHVETPMTHEEVMGKFNRVCDFRSVSSGQKDRARAAWSNLRAVKDIAEPMRDLANFGRPLPL